MTRPEYKNRILKILLPLTVIISGWLMIGIGYTTKIGHPISTILFLGGIVSFIIGCIWFIISIKNLN